MERSGCLLEAKLQADSNICRPSVVPTDRGESPLGKIKIACDKDIESKLVTVVMASNQVNPFRSLGFN